jgi:hypothetical protein
MKFGSGYEEVDIPIGMIALLIALLIALAYGITFVATGGDLAIYSFWAPKQARAENKVFHQTQQYTDGKNVHMIELCGNMAAADPGSAAARAFASEIRVEAATIDVNDLTADVQSCVSQAKGF